MTLDSTNANSYSVRFWSKVMTLSADGCWPWLGHIDKYGYGAFKVNYYPEKAHRVVWVLVFGEIPPGMSVCHKCDKPACVNPKHLFLGTNSDNMADMDSKGRRARGEINGHALLSNTQALEAAARLRNGETATKLAKEYGVHQTTMSNLKVGKSWSHVTGIKRRCLTA